MDAPLTNGVNKMKITIHDISMIKLNNTTTNRYSATRSLYIFSDEFEDGEIEIQLFNEDADKLKVFNLLEDKSL